MRDPRWIDFRDQFPAHEQGASRGGPEKPFVTGESTEVAVQVAHVNRQLADRLSGVHE